MLVLLTELIKIRPAQEADARAYLCFLQAVTTETAYVPVSPEMLAMPLAYWRLTIQAIQNNPNDVLMVAIYQTQIIGAIRLNSLTEPGLTHIGELSIAVLEAAWHQGIGTRLMQQLLATLRKNRQPRRIELTVQARNQRAIELYQRCGFSIEAQLAAGYYAADVGFLPVVQMSQLMNMDERV